MFKRRRDESEGAGTPVEDVSRPATPAMVSGTRPTAPTTAGSADNGLDRPPFRPVSNKEVPSMARSPFNPSPPNQPPGAPAGIPPRPQGQPGIPIPQGAPPPGGPGPGMQQQVQPVRQQERRTLVVGRGISLQGLIQDAERLVVEGTVEAQLLHAQELAVAPGGIFKGEVEVEDAEIAGTIDGAVTARGNLVIRGTGRVIGTARCRRLQVEDGGQISGKMEMITEGPPPRGPDRTA